MTYKDEYIASTQHPDEFWLEQAQKLAWFQPPQKGCQPTDNGYFDWFRGGQLNTSYLALDHHVKNGRGDKTALIYDSPVTQTTQHFTYKEL
ncbi:MAG: acetyl-coenzyme A synthetase N-terminal domain-containing protein, partial [Pseudomonadota bacterium]|nr:acetyl-coenzyme A synthetase N-terminal domain-containing protein [Pseudomonadota bacterium]